MLDQGANPHTKTSIGASGHSSPIGACGYSSPIFLGICGEELLPDPNRRHSYHDTTVFGWGGCNKTGGCCSGLFLQAGGATAVWNTWSHYGFLTGDVVWMEYNPINRTLSMKLCREDGQPGEPTTTLHTISNIPKRAYFIHANGGHTGEGMGAWGGATIALVESRWKPERIGPKSSQCYLHSLKTLKRKRV